MSTKINNLNKSNKHTILDEFTDVTRELENVRSRVGVIKNITLEKVKNAKSDAEKKSIFVEFQGEVNKIKKDKDLKRR
jgi:copper chaperone CopZ